MRGGWGEGAGRASFFTGNCALAFTPPYQQMTHSCRGRAKKEGGRRGLKSYRYCVFIQGRGSVTFRAGFIRGSDLSIGERPGSSKKGGTN